MPDPIIFHVDVNSAFLSWTASDRMAKGIDKVDLRDLPSAIGGDPKTRHGIITAKSIPAKRYGIVTGEPVSQALRKCPSLILVPGDYSLYARQSQALMDLLRKYAPAVDPFSIDEAFCDMTGTASLYGDPVLFAHKLKDEIRRDLGFTVNVGISSNHLLAKMASDFTKPDRVHTLWPREIPRKMWPLPAADLLFVGESTAQKLKSLGILTIGDLAGTPEDLLVSHFGKHGSQMLAYANGTEPSDLTSRHRKSRGFSNEITISHDLVDWEEARLILLSLCETLAARIRLQGDKIRLVGVYYKDSSFVSASRQTRLNRSSSSTQTIYETALSLLHELWDGRPLRLLGVRGSEIDKNSGSYQMDLFDAGKNRKLDQLDAAVDQIRDKFGDSSIRRAVFLGADETDLKKRRSNRSRKKPEGPTEPETPCC